MYCHFHHDRFRFLDRGTCKSAREFFAGTGTAIQEKSDTTQIKEKAAKDVNKVKGEALKGKTKMEQKADEKAREK